MPTGGSLVGYGAGLYSFAPVSSSPVAGVFMRLEAIAIGRNPPDEVNVVVEVPVGGVPI